MPIIILWFVVFSIILNIYTHLLHDLFDIRFLNEEKTSTWKRFNMVIGKKFQISNDSGSDSVEEHNDE